MALRFADSFDHWATAEYQKKWTDYNDLFGTIGITSGGRFVNAWNQPSDNRRLYKRLDSGHATWIVGAAFVYGSFGAGGTVFAIADAQIGFPTDNAFDQVQLFLRTDGKLQLFRGNQAASLAIGTRTLLPNVWYYIELKVTVGNSGSFEWRVDGVADGSGSGVDTQATANATADSICLGRINGNNFAGCAWEDLYVCDGSGSAPTNDFLGDIRVEALFPNGNGNSSQLLGSDGNSVDNHLLVDETPANGDTDYVESSTVGQKDTYAFANMTSVSGTVYAVQVLGYVRKTDAGTRRVASIARLSGTEVDSANFTLSTTYQLARDIRETKPGGGVWTISDVNSAEFGMKVSA